MKISLGSKIMSNLFFVFSAMIVAGGLVTWKQNGFSSTCGYLLALFWILSAYGYRGLTNALLERNAHLEKTLIEVRDALVNEANQRKESDNVPSKK